MLFDMLFQGKSDAFLRNTAKLKKPGRNAFHLYDDPDTDITKVKCSKFLEMSYN